MTTLNALTVTECAAIVADTLDEVFAAIRGWRRELENDFESNGAPAVLELDERVERLVVPTLTGPDPLVIGAGFVARPGFIPDAPWHLAWWLGSANTFGVGRSGPALRRLAAVEDERAENFRDYTTLEWWRVPIETGRSHITGPYVDYLCTDDYTLTLTSPVSHAGSLVGVVGADLYVNDVERLLLPAVRAVPGGATLVNASGRVVLSSERSRPTGSLLRPNDSATPSVSTACGGTSLSLLTAR